jgi:hypothetical protein
MEAHPGQVATLPGELVADPRMLLLAEEELLACGKPFLTGSDSVISHSLSHLVFLLPTIVVLSQGLPG